MRALPLACLWCGLVTACSQDDDCSLLTVDAVAVDVRDTNGDPICHAQIHVTTFGLDKTFNCSADAGLVGVSCCLFGTTGPPNHDYTIEVTAAGYLPVTKKVFVPEKDCGNPVTQHVAIEMEQP